MTEDGWLTATDPTLMLEILNEKATNRKFRLLAIACCRRYWHLFDDANGRSAIGAAEQCAEGTLSVDELWAIGKNGDLGFNYDLHKHIAQGIGVDSETVGSAFYAVGLIMGMMGWRQASSALEAAASTAGVAGLGDKADKYSYDEQEEYERAALPFTSVEKVAQVALLRDIFGNPFRPVVFDPEWRTPTAVLLAQQMYESRDFATMPILADALQDAGCDHEDILNHCRQPGEHVRGCWAVDLVLGKS